MSGKTGVADTSRGPLLRGELRTHPSLGIRVMSELRRVKKMSYQAIADELGLTYRQVYKALNREKVREWDRASDQRHRAEIKDRTLARRRERSPLCERCGQPLSRPTNQSPCRKCRSEIYDENLRYIAKAWNAGATAMEISAVLGIPPNSVSTMASLARKRGYDVVFRRPGRPRTRQTENGSVMIDQASNLKTGQDAWGRVSGEPRVEGEACPPTAPLATASSPPVRPKPKPD